MGTGKPITAVFVLLATVCSLCHVTCIRLIDTPPSMDRQPSAGVLFFKVATENGDNEEPFLLDCVASGHPAPTYKWFKNGKVFEFEAYDDRISQQPGRGTLVFTRPMPEDEGHYQCHATNQYGTSLSNVVSVIKSEMGSFRDEPTVEKVVNEGEPLTLTCIPPISIPKPQIYWIIESNDSGTLKSINDSRITVDPEGALHFSNVTTFDSYVDAHYACSASILFRDEYKLGNKFKLTVLLSGSTAVQSKHAPVKQYCSPPNIVSRRGEQQDIHCIYGGTPLPEISWRKKNDRLNPNRYTVLNYGKTLRLNKVDFEDQGMYECMASNGVGSVQSWASSITVQSIPYWITAPNNTNAAEEESVRFECKASGEPEPSVQWFVNGVDIAHAPGNSRRKLISPTVLTIDNLIKTDTSVYQCNASNALGYAFKDFYLNVLSLAPKITRHPEKLYETVEGAPVTLHCRFFGAPQPQVQWNRGDKQLTGGRYMVEPNGDLHIPRALFTDAGRYKCFARNKLGFASSDDSLGQLEVYVKTQVSAEPEDYEVTAGKSATFRCNTFSDIHLKKSIEWQANGQTIDFISDPRMYLGADSSLTISKTTELDSGVYRCIVRTKLDNESAEAYLIVQDRPNPPHIDHIECYPKMARLSWRPMGDNRSPITDYVIEYNTNFAWEFWQLAQPNVGLYGYTFQVPLNPWTNTSFRVIAVNKIGGSRSSKLSDVCATPPDVPYKNPENVRGFGTTPNNLNISWTAMPQNEHNGPNFFYRVYWKQNIPGMKFQTVDINDWKQDTVVLENQPTNQKYRIRVEAHNSMGPANVTAVEVIGYSGEDQPLESLIDLILRDLENSKTADIERNPVSPESVRGRFKGYKAQTWSCDKEVEKMEELVSPGKSQVTPYSLRPFLKNCIPVLPYNDPYDGPPSNVITIQTPEGKPGPVSSFEAVPMGSSVLKLIWSKPQEPNGNLISYHIFFQKITASNLYDVADLKPIVVDPQATSTKLIGLEPSTKYRVQISAETKAGLGAEYFIDKRTGHETRRRPDKPLFDLSPLEMTDGLAGVNVTWHPNMDGQPGSHFYVEYRPKSESRFQKTADVLYDETVDITDLKPDTEYELRVVAVDGGYRTPSNVKVFATDYQKMGSQKVCKCFFT